MCDDKVEDLIFLLISTQYWFASINLFQYESFLSWLVIGKKKGNKAKSVIQGLIDGEE